MKKILCLLFAASICHGSLQTYPIKTLTGVIIEVKLAPENTILDLKNALHEQRNIPLREQRILFQRRDLQDDETIADTIFGQQDPIHLVLRLSGGGYVFKDITQAKHHLVSISFADEAGPWRVIHPGLNMVGCCTNDQCEAFSQEVGCPIGFSTFDISIPVACPMCEHEVVPSDCIYYQCHFKFEATKSDGEIHSSEWLKTKGKNSCKKISEKIGCSGFKKLKIFCKKLNP